MKICSKCKKPKLIEDFGNNRTNKDGKQRYCKECGRESDRRCYSRNAGRRKKIAEARQDAIKRNRLFVLRHLLAHPCVECGEDNPFFLDFDHVVGEKRHEVSTLVRHCCGVETIQEEIDKCEVRCLKCHRIQTAKRGGWYDRYMADIAEVNATFV